MARSHARLPLIAALASPLESRTYALWRLDVEAGTSQLLGQVEGSIFLWSPHGASWSPDGTRLLYIRMEGEERAIILADADGSGAIEVARGRFPNLLGWSPAGQIALYEETGRLYAVHADPGRPQVQAVGEFGGEWGEVFWRQDGFFFAVDGRLFRAALDGTRVQEVFP